MQLARGLTGGAVWAAVFAFFRPEWSIALMWFGALALVPLALAFFDDRPGPTMLLAGRLQLPAAILLVVAFEMPELAMLFAAPWLAFTGMAGAAGGKNLVRSGLRRASAFADVALLFLPVHGFWLAASLTGWNAFGFPPVIVTLAAVHMLYAGFVLHVIAAQIIAARPARVPVFAALGMLAGYVAVAGAITASYLHGFTRLEFPAVCLYGGSVIVLGWMQLFVALRPRSNLPWFSRMLLVISDLSLGTAVTLAFIFAWGVHRGLPTLTIPQMITWHGTLNVFGFALCGVAGWLTAGRVSPR